MTLWQDPPPQTRRQARESERAAAERADAGATSRRAATATPTPAGEIPQVTTPFVFSSAQRESATDTLTAPAEPRGAAPTRPRLPRYEALPFDAVLNQPPAAENVFKPAPDPARPEPVTAPVALSEPQAPAAQQAPVQHAPAAEVAPVQPPAATPQVPAAEHTLTRRELRAMLQAQEANQQVTRQAPEATAQTPVESVPVSPYSDLAAGTHPVTEPSPTSFEPVAAPHSAAPSDPLVGDPVGAGETPDDAEVHHRRSFQPPTGHWSIAAALDDDDEHTPPGGISRSAVSSGAATTSNALIMPVVPSVADATGPLTSTGEILVTGSIDLPRGLGSTGQHPDHFDSSDLDRMFDQPEAVVENTGSVAPVRASRAVSTHTSTRGMITPPNRRGNKLPTALAITAAVLALGVVGLLVAGYVFHVF